MTYLIYSSIECEKIEISFFTRSGTNGASLALIPNVKKEHLFRRLRLNPLTIQSSSQMNRRILKKIEKKMIKKLLLLNILLFISNRF